MKKLFSRQIKKPSISVSDQNKSETPGFLKNKKKSVQPRDNDDQLEQTPRDEIQIRKMSQLGHRKGNISMLRIKQNLIKYERKREKEHKPHVNSTHENRIVSSDKIKKKRRYRVNPNRFDLELEPQVRIISYDLQQCSQFSL